MDKISSDNIEDILGLTFMQKIMLFNYLYSNGGKEYKEHTRYKLTGEKIYYDTLIKAWDYVVQNNELLRVIYRWKNLNSPVQIVLKKSYLPVNEYDVSPMDENERQKEADAIDAKDIEKEIDLEQCPIRMNVCILSQNEFEISITNHHIIFDGWSNAILLNELLGAYNSFLEGNTPMVVEKGKYKEYIKWLKVRETLDYKRFWKSYLEGYQYKAMFSQKKNIKQRVEVEKFLAVPLPEKLGEKMNEYAKRMQVTLAAIIYSVWGILLSKRSNRNDVVFGITLSIRPPEISGVENIVGLFINTVPIRVDVDPEETGDELIVSLNRKLNELEEYKCTSMVDINACSGVKQGEQLYDSIVVVQNYPLDVKRYMENSHLKLSLYSRTYKTNMNLTLTFRNFDGMFLDFTYNSDNFNDNDIHKLVTHFGNILQNIVCEEEIDKTKIKDMGRISPVEQEEFKNCLAQNAIVLKQMKEVDFDEIF